METIKKKNDKNDDYFYKCAFGCSYKTNRPGLMKIHTKMHIQNHNESKIRQSSSSTRNHSKSIIPHSSKITRNRVKKAVCNPVMTNSANEGNN